MASLARVEQFASPDGARTTRDGGRGEKLVDFQRRADVEYARSLSRLIESEIIPRLLVAHGSGPAAAPGAAHDDCISAEEVEAFAPLSLHVEADELLEHVEGLVARGVSHNTLLVDLLAPAARLLGQFWEDDRCDFVDVTMGLWRLQEVVHEISARLPHDHRHPFGQERRALFASLEGDQHSFGTVVIDELFSANGWLTDRLSEATTVELLQRVSDEWFDMAGLTITCDCHIAPLASIVRSIRDSSRNPRIRVMVGGRVFAANADLAKAVGADGTAPDARIAIQVADELVDAVVREAASSMSG